MGNENLSKMKNIALQYPQFAYLSSIEVSQQTTEKLAFGSPLSGIDNKNLLDNPNSLEYKRLAFNLMCESFLTEHEKNQHHLRQLFLLNQKALETYFADHNSKTTTPEDAVKILKNDIATSQTLLSQNQAEIELFKHKAAILITLYQKESLLTAEISQQEKNERETFNQLLTAQGNFTEAEYETYQLTGETQQKLHEDYQETKANFEKLSDMINQNSDIAQEMPSELIFANRFEIKYLSAITHNKEDAFLVPSLVSRLSATPELFNSILENENKISGNFSELKQTRANINQTENELYAYAQKIGDNNEQLSIFNDPLFLSANSADQLLKKLWSVFNLENLDNKNSDNKTREIKFNLNQQVAFETRLAFKCRQMSDEDQKNLYALKDEMAKKLLNQHQEFLFSTLNNIFSESLPNFSPRVGL